MMRKLIFVMSMIILMSATMFGYSKHYCDICDTQITDNENRFIQTPSFTYSMLCADCYRYLDKNIEETIEDIRKASAITQRQTEWE